MPRSRRDLLEVLDEACALDGTDDDSRSVGYMARLFAQTSMPYRDPGDVPGWGRSNGLVSLGIQPGVTFDPDGRARSLGVPYGTYPRLLLAWISREAVHTRERTLIFGDSLSEFMRELGLLPGGGRWGAITRLRDQMRRLFAARITCTHVSPEGFGLRNVQIADEALLWWDPKDPAQAALWQSTVTLSEPFFREVLTRPVPVDMRVLRRLKDSPMRLDIYCWLTHRMYGLRRPVQIGWAQLEQQFGAAYADTRFFRRQFRRNLARVLVEYRDARVRDEADGLVLLPSPTHVPARGSGSSSVRPPG